MSNGFDIWTRVVYLEFMFADRVRRAVQVVTRRVDVWPDTLVLRAMEPASPGRADSTTRTAA